LTHNGQYVSFNFPEKLLAFYVDSAMENKDMKIPDTVVNRSGVTCQGRKMLL
ncbi:hypothetical protein ABIA64_000001, partial [Paenibacillus sp. RC253]